MVRDLRVHKLEPVRGTDNDGAVVLSYHSPISEFPEGGEGHPRVRAVEHSCAVGHRRHVHELLLGRFLHYPIRVLEGLDGAVNRHGVANLDGGREGGLRLDRLEVLIARLVHTIEGVGVLGLGHNHAWDTVRETEVLAHFEALVERVAVSEVSSRDDEPVRDLPVELLGNLYRGGLLPFDPEAVHGVRQVYRRLSGNLLNQLHAPVEVRVYAQNQRAVRNGLHELGDGDLVRGEEDYGRDVSGGTVGRQGGRRVPGRGATHGRDGLGVHPPDFVHLAHQHRHAEVLEGAGVAVPALLYPEVGHA
mmetsp:Transcript_11033/g.27888  ORF Transcript_11033/g.27888 Transcript_11033/m.27888 type:complete len:304 (-) Transcript_11033:479-1390(-)